MNLIEMVIQILKQISFKSIPKKQSWNMEIDIKKLKILKFISFALPRGSLYESPSAFLHPIVNSIKTTPQLHLSFTFAVYHKGVPQAGHHRSGKRPRRKTTLGGTQVDVLFLLGRNEVAGK